MTKNEYIASIMLEAAELLKNDNIESLNESYTKKTYNQVKDDFKNIKRNMIKANTMRIESDFDKALELLNKTLKMISDTKNKVNNLKDPKLLKTLSALIGAVYISSKTNLSADAYDKGISISAQADDDDLRGIKRVMNIYLNACVTDVKNLIALCKKKDSSRLENKVLAAFNVKERGAYNYDLLNRASSKESIINFN